MRFTFYKNNISQTNLFYDVSPEERLKNIGQYTVFAIKSQNRHLLSWCLFKLLEQIHFASFSLAGSPIRIVSKDLDKEVLPNNFTVLYLWYLHKLFHLENNLPCDEILKSAMVSINTKNFSDELESLHKILLEL
ncbi:hypothetical protein Lbir_1328 [Legionella birminghamensis]|uniref:Uncharacterized protein n=1 Tax=Legionella birminghamensis TaxID=28083 RepID=A0A378IA77_9GAMM|nr:hypothetical protein Lbir_1328 [Legionella birminghamensis]STX32137.1 Uncharacterised protein [Legionella birminghamensis]